MLTLSRYRTYITECTLYVSHVLLLLPDYLWYVYIQWLSKALCLKRYLVTYCTIIIALNYINVYFTKCDVKIPKTSSTEVHVYKPNKYGTDPQCVYAPLWLTPGPVYIPLWFTLCPVSYFLFSVSNRTGLSMLPRQTGLPESCFIAEEAVDWCIQNIQEVKDVTSGIGLMQVRVNFYYIYKDLQKKNQTFNRPCTVYLYIR